MADSLSDYLRANRLGEILAVQALKGSLSLPTGESPTASLVRTDRGLFLAAAIGATDGRYIDLARSRCRYAIRRLGDRLIVGEGEEAAHFGVPARRGEKVQSMIALSRLGSPPPAGAAGAAGAAGRHVEGRSPVEAAWLATALASEELLVWLHTTTDAEIPSDILPGATAPWRLLLTDQRALLVAISAVGDVRLVPLPPAPLQIENNIGRDRITAGEIAFHTSRSNEALFAEIAPLPALDAPARLRVVARLCWLKAGKDAALHDRARALLARAAERGDPLAQLGSGEALDEVGDAALITASDADAGKDLADWWERWELEEAPADGLIQRLRGLSRHRAALPLHRRLHARMAKRTKDSAALALLDIAFARHLIDAEAHAEAVGLLEARLAALPDEELADLLPPPDADLTQAEGGQALRIAVLELLVEARGEAGEAHPETLIQLAMLEPLVPERLEAAAATAAANSPGSAAAAAAAAALALLQPGGLRREATTGASDDAPTPASGAPPGLLSPLSVDLVNELLQHPAARSTGALGRLQGMLASVDVPDRSDLKAWCERLKSAHPAQDALTDAALVLGVAGAEAFISRGEKGLSLRAYEGSPPFLLIGGDHLDADSSAWLDPMELRFLIGAEIAHVRFRHSRVTSSEVWSGAWEKSIQGLDIFIGLVPVLGNFGPTKRLADLAGKVGDISVVQTLAEHQVTKKAINYIRPRSSDTSEVTIGQADYELVAAHRVMQLTADRAGLLLSGDLAASLRGIFRSHPVYLAELPLAEKHGLSAVLRRRDARGEVIHQQLAVRIAALISFSLSPDFQRLRAAIAA